MRRRGALLGGVVGGVVGAVGVFSAAVSSRVWALGSEPEIRNFEKVSGSQIDQHDIDVDLSLGGRAGDWPLLPYASDALQPVISASTMGFHHARLHKNYADKLKGLLKQTPSEGLMLAQVVRSSFNEGERLRAVYVNAAQCWNHALQWVSLSPTGGGVPPQTIRVLLERDFESLEGFTRAFSSQAVSFFGSGWVWLVWDLAAQKLVIQTTKDADTPMTSPGMLPLANLDVWEHAYYTDYPAARKDYVEAVMAKLFNWRTVEERLSRVRNTSIQGAVK
jgi:superoxide dismutase, Fe-Mn family